MTTLTITFPWWGLGIGFLLGGAAMATVIFIIIAIVEKNCTCDAWKVSK